MSDLSIYYHETQLTAIRLGDIVNKFRKSLDLDEIPYAEGPFLATKLKIPFTYCWSPALVPKPNDWPAHIGMHRLNCLFVKY